MLNNCLGKLEAKNIAISIIIKRGMEPLSNKYDALLEDSSNETSIVSHYASIIELKKS